MIPIQTLLALLTVLMLCSCSQEKPPHTGGTQGLTQGTDTNTTTATSPTPTPSGNLQTTGNDPKDHVKPTTDRLKPSATNCAMDTANDSEWKFVLTGGDAQMLYHATEIKALVDPQTGVKSKVSQEYACRITADDLFECEWSMATSNFAFIKTPTANQVMSKPEFGTQNTTRLESVYVVLNSNPSPDVNDNAKMVATPYFEIRMKGGYGKMMYQRLPGNETPFHAKGGPKKVRKFGEQVECLHDPALNESTQEAYVCYLYGNLAGGTFLKIAP